VPSRARRACCQCGLRAVRALPGATADLFARPDAGALTARRRRSCRCAAGPDRLTPGPLRADRRCPRRPGCFVARSVPAVSSNSSAWSATRLWGGWIILLHYLVVTGAGPGPHDRVIQSCPNPGRVLEDSYGADPAGATVRAAQFGALALGWRLFERYLVAAGALESIPVQDLRDAVLALTRRIGAAPWPAPPGLRLPGTGPEQAPRGRGGLPPSARCGFAPARRYDAGADEDRRPGAPGSQALLMPGPKTLARRAPRRIECVRPYKFAVGSGAPAVTPRKAGARCHCSMCSSP
jgi:hypothetical protein